MGLIIYIYICLKKKGVKRLSSIVLEELWFK